MSVIEKCARALAARHFADRFGKAVDDPHVQSNVTGSWRLWEDDAIAILTALRDNVSEEMLDTVAPWPKHWPKEELDFPAMNAAYQTDRMVARQRFQEMLTAALEQK